MISKDLLATEYAGGPLGGDNYYFKPYGSATLYVPSFHRHYIGLNASGGYVRGFGGRVVPTYERFRLGGGTTPDPLRGYDHYMVVPGKFVTQVRRDNANTVTVRYPGGRYMLILSAEQQFPVVHPLHGVVFFDAGNTWDQWREIRPFDLKLSAGLGFRMEVPLLGDIGFDYGYGFDRDDGARGTTRSVTSGGSLSQA